VTAEENSQEVKAEVANMIHDYFDNDASQVASISVQDKNGHDVPLSHFYHHQAGLKAAPK